MIFSSYYKWLLVPVITQPLGSIQGQFCFGVRHAILKDHIVEQVWTEAGRLEAQHRLGQLQLLEYILLHLFDWRFLLFDQIRCKF